MFSTFRYYHQYGPILLGSWFFLTATALNLTFGVALLDLTQGENSRILYVHVPVAWMSILVYIITAINTFFFLFKKHPLFLRFSGTGVEIGALFTLLTLVTGGFWGRPMWGTFWVWDGRLTSVFILFLIYLGILCFQKLSVELASISICVGLIDIPIIKFSVNWWNTLHQPGTISRSSTSIHVSMLIPILSHLANFVLLTSIFFVLEGHLIIKAFRSSSLTEERDERIFLSEIQRLFLSQIPRSKGRSSRPSRYHLADWIARESQKALFAKASNKSGQCQ